MRDDQDRCSSNCHGRTDGSALGTTRRDFFRLVASGSAGLFLASGLDIAACWAGDDEGTKARKGGRKKGGGAKRPPATNLIVLWMGGGPSQLDTWDPKPGHENGGPYRAIKTPVDGMRISEHLPRMAAVSKDIAIINSLTTREGNHDRGRYLLHTGYAPGGAVKHPSLGSVISSELGDPDGAIPDYIAIAGASLGAGFLGVQHEPLILRDPGRPVDDLAAPAGIQADRYRRRLELLKGMSKDFEERRGMPEPAAERRAVTDRAVRLMQSPLITAFDLKQEKPKIREAYGDNRFGQGCLLAARLVASGVRCVEVALGGWDTHQENFERLKGLSATLDQGFATLISDLKRRGLLDTTIILWAGEFGRTPKINPNAGRDHFPRAWSCVLAGGGLNTGQVIGATSADGMEVADRPVKVPELMATIQNRMGIDHEKTLISPNGRPIDLSDKGVPMPELV